MLHEYFSWFAKYLHDSVPVVSRGNAEQSEECHAEVLKCSMSAQTLTWALLSAFWFKKTFILILHLKNAFICFMQRHTLPFKAWAL